MLNGANNDESDHTEKTDDEAVSSGTYKKSYEECEAQCQDNLEEQGKVNPFSRSFNFFKRMNLLKSFFPRK